MRRIEPLFDGYGLYREEGVFPLTQDTVLLSAFVRPAPGERLLELGTGGGALAVLLLLRNPEIAVDGVEIEGRAAALAEENLALNGLSDRGRIICGDFRERNGATDGLYDRCVSNPPYYRPNGRPGRTPGARSALTGGLGEVCRAARRALKPGGRFDCCYPADQADALRAILAECGLAPLRTRLVRHSARHRPSLILAEAGEGGEERAEEPLILYDETGRMTEECQEIYRR